MSDKTTAALAAEQADAEATTTQETELLPAATLDELEQVDLGTVAEGERAPFRITDDRCADWAIRKIADERSEYDLRDPGHLHGRRVRRHRYGRNQENRGGRCCGPS